jgi:hypothetical protein
MRRLGVWGMAGALLVGLAASVHGADDRPGNRLMPAPSGPWQPTWTYGPDRGPIRQPAKTVKPAKTEKEDKPLDKTASGPTTAEKEAERQREWNALWRRLDVCQRLQQVAAETDNPELQRQAERLEEQAWAVFEQRTGQREPGLDLDEANLGQRLGAGAGHRLTAPGRAERAKDENGRTAAVREDKP